MFWEKEWLHCLDDLDTAVNTKVREDESILHKQPVLTRMTARRHPL
jgi:hypothetical protein